MAAVAEKKLERTPFFRKGKLVISLEDKMFETSNVSKNGVYKILGSSLIKKDEEFNSIGGIKRKARRIMENAYPGRNIGIEYFSNALKTEYSD